MDCNASLDIQHIFTTDDESLDSPIDIMKRLQLDRRLPEGRKTCEQLLKTLELQSSPGDQEKKVDKQFVFHGQCLVLGDSGVGKTSLVKSLTGQPFDHKQPKTQGIDQSLVDENWKRLTAKGLTFGMFSRFYQRLVVQLTLFAPGNATNILYQDTADLVPGEYSSRVLKMIVLVLVLVLVLVMDRSISERQVIHFSFFLMFFLDQIGTLCSVHSNITLRHILAAFVFSFSDTLAIGVLLALVVFDTKFTGAITIEGYLCGAIVSAPVVAAWFLFRKTNWTLGITRQCRYPGQLTLTNQQSVGMICFCRLLLTILFGFTFSTCFMLAHLSKLSPEVTGKGIDELTTHFILVLIIELVPKLIESKPGPNTICLILVVTELVRASLNSPRLYFVVIFPLFFCDTLYRQWFRIQFLRNVHDNGDGSKSFTAIAIIKALLNTNALKRALDKKFASLTLKILDFAGDDDYYAFHHMFLRRQAIYVIAYNMAEFAENEFGETEAKVKRLQFWFESICSHVPPTTPIFLVGTHTGNMDKDWMGIVDEHLRRTLWDTYCDELVVNDADQQNLIFFPVENSNGNKDAGVQALQKKIMSVAQECRATIACDIPLSWIRIQDAIIALQEKKEAKFCLTLEEFPVAFDNYVCTNWSTETLKYFHEKGLIIYLDKDQDLSNWVLLKPEILVDVIIQLIMPPPGNIKQRGLRCDWNLLQRKGVLTKSLLRSIISKVQENEEAMTAFLEEYDLICSLRNKKVEVGNLRQQDERQPTHFVPSLLPMSADGEQPVWHDDDTDKKFYVFFNRFLPEPLFHRLLSRAHKNSKVEFPNGSTVLYRNAGKFWMSAWQPYRLELMKEEKMVEVTFSCR